MTTHASEAMVELIDRGLSDFAGDRSTLFVRVLRQLARGRPVTAADVDAMIADLDLDTHEARAFLDPRSEHDAAGNVVGFGLTLNPTPHRVTIEDTAAFAWCALDTLVFASLLEKTVNVESTAPETGAVTRLAVGPDGVSRVDPPEALITLPVIDPEHADTSTVAAIWATFCHRSYLFPSHDEARRWASGNDRVEVASLDEGFALARRLALAFLSYSSGGSGQA